jgi:hypothetical protein
MTEGTGEVSEGEQFEGWFAFNVINNKEVLFII